MQAPGSQRASSVGNAATAARFTAAKSRRLVRVFGVDLERPPRPAQPALGVSLGAAAITTATPGR